MEEVSALRGFYAATHYDENFAYKVGTSQNGFNTATGAKAESVTANSDNLQWLNAYNAPHWMNIYKSLKMSYEVNATSNGFTSNQGRLEVYGTSWTRDLLAAWKEQQSALTRVGLNSGPLGIGGFNDPTFWAHSGHKKGGHSAGMAIDLVVRPWISDNNQKSTGTGTSTVNGELFPSLVGPPYWSVGSAVNLSSQLPTGLFEDTRNDQRDALRNFLALYAVTRNDGTRGNGIGWDDLRVSNEAVRSALFGTGQNGLNGGGLISNVWIGGNGDQQNQYENIRIVLDSLGIHNGTQGDHHTHFHVDVRRPDPVGITANLLAESPSLDQTQETGSEALQQAAQTLLAQLQPSLDFTQGDVAMFVMDVPPDVPPQYAPVVIAQTSQAQQDPLKIDRTIGVCQLVENPIRVFEDGPLKGRYWATNDVGPAGAAHNYLWSFERRQRDPGYKVSLLKNPDHGTLKPIVDPATGKETDGGWHYIAENGYLGPDRATFLVETGGMKIKVEYFIEVLKGVWMDAYEDPKLCPKGHYWKISLNPDDPNAPIYTFDHPSQLTSPYAGLSNVT